ncbi:MAG: HAMP domain-containing protein [Alphaproteobacteria bacterium]|nr:HAMP domain-containing protein [Alphaproteobacteria bacterium]
MRIPNLSIKTLLPLAFGGLVVLALVPMLAASYLTAQAITQGLLSDRIDRIVEGIVGRIDSHLEPVRTQLDYVGETVRTGRVDPRDPRAFDAFLIGALAASPQVTGFGFVRPDLSMRRFNRGDFVIYEDPPDRVPFAADAIAGARDSTAPRWAAPFRSIVLGQTVVTLRMPLHSADGFEGVLVAAITVADLSLYLRRIGEGRAQRPFILYGEGRVIAHRGAIALPPPPVDAEMGGLPRLDAVGDPVLAGIWTLERRSLEAILPAGPVRGHWSWVGEASHGYFYRPLVGYGGEPWIVGFHEPGTETRQARWFLNAIAIIGAALLFLGIAAAVVLARRLERPILALADAARRVEALDFARVGPLPRGPVREIDAASGAIERMAGALGWFETYLPRTVVRRLLATGADAPRSATRALTIMFVDLQGFTRFSAGRPSEEASGYLNDVFARIGPLIEGSGGTIDKYLGDGLLAFWGAPDDRPDHAMAACRSALEIIRTETAFWRERLARGEPACRLRIGLHSGAALVGNVGFVGRINYTVVGEAVNTAQRIEQLGRAEIGEAAAICLASEATRQAAANAFEFAPTGRRAEGTADGVAVWRLIGLVVDSG